MNDEQRKSQERQVRTVFEKVYDVLVRRMKASDTNRQNFVNYHTLRHRTESTSCGNTSEWRFMGCLGMGGKFWVSIEGFRVSCYTEDRTPARIEAMEQANKELQELFYEWRKICDSESE